MLRSFVVNPILCAIAGGISAACLVLAGVQVYLGRPVSVAVFALIAMVFFSVSLSYGSVVEVDKTGVRRKTLGRVGWSKTWSEIREVGVVGTRAFHKEDAKNVGFLYIYFSCKEMTDTERFQMILRWPPKEQCYLLFHQDRLRAIQMIWDSHIGTYNAGDISFGEGLSN